MEDIQMANKYIKRFSISFVEIKVSYIKKHVILESKNLGNKKKFREKYALHYIERLGKFMTLVNGLSGKGSEIFTAHMST